MSGHARRIGCQAVERNVLDYAAEQKQRFPRLRRPQVTGEEHPQYGCSRERKAGRCLPDKGYAGDSAEHWPSHLMFFYSQTDPATWGEGLPGSPILAMSDTQEHLTTFAIGVQRWSDGTEAR